MLRSRNYFSCSSIEVSLLTITFTYKNEINNIIPSNDLCNNTGLRSQIFYIMLYVIIPQNIFIFPKIDIKSRTEMSLVNLINGITH